MRISPVRVEMRKLSKYLLVYSGHQAARRLGSHANGWESRPDPRDWFVSEIFHSAHNAYTRHLSWKRNHETWCKMSSLKLRDEEKAASSLLPLVMKTKNKRPKFVCSGLDLSFHGSKHDGRIRVSVWPSCSITIIGHSYSISVVWLFCVHGRISSKSIYDIGYLTGLNGLRMRLELRIFPNHFVNLICPSLSWRLSCCCCCCSFRDELEWKQIASFAVLDLSFWPATRAWLTNQAARGWRPSDSNGSLHLNPMIRVSEETLRDQDSLEDPR